MKHETTNILQQVRAIRTARRPEIQAESMPVPASISQLYQRQASLDPHWCDPKVERDLKGRLLVSHAVSLGAAPMLEVTWKANPSWYERGYRVELFISMTGFAAMSNLTPLEQLDHGRCIGEAHGNDRMTVALNEGTSFLTVLLVSKRPTGMVGRWIASKRQQLTGSPVTVAAIVRFVIDVPSLKLANERIMQQTMLNENVVKNIAARVQLTSASGELDTDWYAARHENDVRRQTMELLATWRGIESAIAAERERIASDASLSGGKRAQMLAILDNLRLSKLRMHQVPVPDSPGTGSEAKRRDLATQNAGPDQEIDDDTGD